jgi:hypothetical protein
VPQNTAPAQLLCGIIPYFQKMLKMVLREDEFHVLANCLLTLWTGGSQSSAKHFLPYSLFYRDDMGNEERYIPNKLCYE